MAKIFYNVFENTKMGTHSWFARPKFGTTLTDEDLLEDAFDGTSVEMEIGKAAVSLYKKAIRRAVLRGNRCNLGDDFVTLYPNLQLSVKDRIDPSTGETIVATADMLDAHNAVSKIGCSVSTKFSKDFATSVQWKKANGEYEGVPTEDATQNNENVENGEDNTQTQDSSNPGGGGSTGDGAND